MIIVMVMATRVMATRVMATRVMATRVMATRVRVMSRVRCTFRDGCRVRICVGLESRSGFALELS